MMHDTRYTMQVEDPVFKRGYWILDTGYWINNMGFVW